MEFINMDKRFKLSKILIWLLFSAMLMWRPTRAFGFDSANSCSPNGGGAGGGGGGKMSRRGRAQLLATIPCDLTRQPYCNLPGSSYPWQAVRRFLHDNQGLVRRMYGDMRHISVLRDELESNEIDGADMEMAAERYTHDGGARRSSKFLQNRDEFAAPAAPAAAVPVGLGGLAGGKSGNDVLMEPHFRPVSTTPAAAAAADTAEASVSSTTATSATTTTTSTAALPATTTSAPPSSTTTTATAAAATDNRSTKGRGGGTTTAEPVNISSTTPATTLPAESSAVNATTTSSATSTPGSTRYSSNGKGGGIYRRRVGATTSHTKLSGSVANSTAAMKETPLEHAIETNSVLYEAPPPHGAQAPASGGGDADITGDNIHIVDSPQLGMPPMPEALGNVSSLPVSTISTTLKLATSSRVESLMLLSPKKPAQTMRQRPQLQQHYHQQQQHQHQQHQLTATTTKESDNGNKPNESERLAAASSGTTPITTAAIRVATANANATSAATATTATTTAALHADGIIHHHKKKFHGNNQALREQTAELLLTGEKLRRQPLPLPPQPPPPQPTKPAAAAAVLHDGQLFQDTLKQEMPPVVNLRGINACPVKEEVVAPFWANNTRGEVLALLNLYPFEQYVHFEKCTHEHKQMYCRDGCRCEQQFRLHRLLAYDPHNECRGIFSDWFRFPSCCICKCYNVPMEFRATSRSPRSQRDESDIADIDNDDAALWQQQQRLQQQQRRQQPSPLELAEAEVKRAIYEHATEDWYRPKEDFDFYEG